VRAGAAAGTAAAAAADADPAAAAEADPADTAGTGVLLAVPAAGPGGPAAAADHPV